MTAASKDQDIKDQPCKAGQPIYGKYKIMNKVSFFSKLVVCFLVLLALIILHVIPLPIFEVLILYVMIFRPVWFKNLVDQLYDR